MTTPSIRPADDTYELTPGRVLDSWWLRRYSWWLRRYGSRLGEVLKRAAPLGVISLVSIAIYAGVIFYQGYISWGNFGTPLALTFSHSFLPTSVTWSPYTSFGTPAVSPAVSLADSVYYPLLLLLGGAWSGYLAMKLLIILSTIFYGAAFYRLTAEFTRSTISRTSATLFMLLNPVATQFVMQGLFQSFFWIGFLFLGLAFIPRAVDAKGIRRVKHGFPSALCIALTIGQPELLYLAVPLYLIFILYFSTVTRGRFDARTILGFVKTAAVCLTLVALFLAPLFLTSFYSAYNIGPSSPYANPLSDYITYSTSVWSMLSMNSNPAYQLQQMIDVPVLSLVWVLAVDVLSLFILAGGLLFRQPRLLFLSTVAFGAALLGAGANSPISSINIYLYEHLFGFQVLNDAYFWAWAVIVPIYGIILSVILEKLYQIATTRTSSTGRPALMAVAPRPRAHRSPALMNAVATAMIAILIFAIFGPLGSSAQYQANGIHSNDLPGDYEDLIMEVQKLVGTSNYGVAYFPPDPGLLFGNSSAGSVNPLLLNPYVRSATPVYYGSVPAPSNYYFTWVYDQFYSNQTKSLAQLMGVMGVKYFVTLNNVNGLGDTYTNLMLYQSNVTLIYTSSDFSIFQSSVPINVAMSVGSWAILSSTYTALQASAKDGIHVTQLPMVFASDINSQNFGFIWSRTAALVLDSPEDMVSIAIARYINESNSRILADEVSNYAYSISNGWVRSPALYTYPQSLPSQAVASSPSAFALTESASTLSSEFNIPGPGNYTLWADVFNSPTPDSTLAIAVGDNSTAVPTSTANNLGGFHWVEVRFHADSNLVMVKVSSSGLNGIYSIAVLKAGLVTSELKFLTSYISNHRLPVVYFGNQTQAANLTELVGAINNSTASNTALVVQDNPNHYTVSGTIGEIALVRLNYFASMIPSDPAISEVPVLGGMSYLLVSNHPLSQIYFVSLAYNPLLIGAVVSTVTFAVCLVGSFVAGSKRRRAFSNLHNAFRNRYLLWRSRRTPTASEE
jgi:hypothetical protein